MLGSRLQQMRPRSRRRRLRCHGNLPPTDGCRLRASATAPLQSSNPATFRHGVMLRRLGFCSASGIPQSMKNRSCPIFSIMFSPDSGLWQL